MAVAQSAQAKATEQMLDHLEDRLTPTVARVLASTPPGLSPVGPLATEFDAVLVPILLERLWSFVDGDPLVAAGFGTGGRVLDAVRKAVALAVRQLPREFPLSSHRPTSSQANTLARRLVRWVGRTALFSAQESTSSVLGYTRKRWVTVGDERVRTNHAVLDGRVVALGHRFHTQGGSILFPGDQTAPMALWINCRCHLELIR